MRDVVVQRNVYVRSCSFCAKRRQEVQIEAKRFVVHKHEAKEVSCGCSMKSANPLISSRCRDKVVPETLFRWQTYAGDFSRPVRTWGGCSGQGGMDRSCLFGFVVFGECFWYPQPHFLTQQNRRRSLHTVHYLEEGSCATIVIDIYPWQTRCTPAEGPRFWVCHGK